MNYILLRQDNNNKYAYGVDNSVFVINTKPSVDSSLRNNGKVVLYNTKLLMAKQDTHTLSYTFSNSEVSLADSPFVYQNGEVKLD